MRDIEILIADDHEVFRRGLRSLLETQSGWHICAEAANGKEAVAKARHLRPDLVLMDVSMPEMSGLEATSLIRRDLPDSEILIISQNDSKAMEKAALRAGARAYIQKSRISKDLFRAIRSLPHNGKGVQVSAAQTSGATANSDLDCLTGGGEMGALMRSLDWSRTPLGPIQHWPQSLKTSVSICLASRFPIVMYWGREYVVIYNDAYSTILGSKHPWALGQCCSDCWAEIWNTIGPMLDGVVQSAQATWSDDLLLLLRRHGYPEECYFSFSFTPVRIETGEVGGVFTAVMETTEKVIGERRLRTLRNLAARAVDATSEAQAWRLAAESLAENRHDIPFAVLCEVEGSNGQGRLLATAGIDPAHPLCTALLTPDSELFQSSQRVARFRQVSECNLQDSFNELPHGAWQVPPEKALLLPIGDLGHEGASCVLLAAVSPHKNLNESYRTFFQLVAHQIATSAADARSHAEERRRAEALAELDRAKTIFFSNVSHEFRTPLTLMLGLLEDVLARPGVLPAEEREHLQTAHRNSLRLLKLVNTLLDFSRIEAGRIQACYEPTDLSSLTAELASQFRSVIERAGLRFTINCPPLAEPVYIDREMWEKIIFNLLSNAFKFTFEGEIEISLRQVESRAELSVRDTGTGIPPEDLPHLFERFHRVKGARGRSYEGSGIGLALVQELVELHGGAVHVKSAVDQGSAFTVTIPLGQDHLPADRVGAARTVASTALHGEAYVEEALRWLPEIGDSESTPAPSVVLAPVDPAGKRPRILLVDDNSDMREYLRRLLSSSYEVQAVADGPAALKAVREQPPDLVLTDIMMPKLDGFGLLKELRSHEHTAAIPVLLLSARAGEESRVEGLQAGADDYLLKPFSARELLARVHSQLNMARIRREAAETQGKLRLDAELLAAIVDSSDDAIVSKNLDGFITSWNQSAQRIFGYTAEEAIGKHISLIIPPDRGKEEEGILARLRRGERVDHFETVRKRKDGTTLELSLTISPVRDASGRVIGASKVARDITERKRIERALRESEERLRKLSETLDAEVRIRTAELESRNAEVLRQSQQLRELSQRLLRAQDDERRHIARELHDSAGQTLTVLGMRLDELVQKAGHSAPQLANDVEMIHETIQQLHKEIRTASYLLHPPLLDETGLAPALTWYVQGLTERSDLDVHLEIAEDFGRLPRHMELAIFRLVQECLTNIHRHSGSKTASIRIVREGGLLIVNVQDKGKGMSATRLAEIQSHGSGLGIRGMRERLRQFEGNLNIESDSSGTRILATIPLPKHGEKAEESGLESLPAAV